jgi:hypothetical protein
VVVALQSDGSHTVASAVGSTSTGNATLSGTNYNSVAWTAPTGYYTVNIYRTVGGATQGKIFTGASNSVSPLSDTGLAASGSAPTANTTGGLSVAGSLTVGGGFNSGVRNVTANDTATATDSTIILNGSSLTETLPASPGSGQELYLVNINASSVTVSGNGNSIWAAGTTASTYTLAANSAGIIQYDNINAIWRVVK